MADVRPPRRVQIGHQRYDLHVDSAEINAQNVADKREYAGWSNASRQLILIAEGLAADYEAETVLHEVLHGCLRAANVDPDHLSDAGVDDVEEQTVGAIAGILVGVLRANPELVSYLTA